MINHVIWGTWKRDIGVHTGFTDTCSHVLPSSLFTRATPPSQLFSKPLVHLMLPNVYEYLRVRTLNHRSSPAPFRALNATRCKFQGPARGRRRKDTGMGQGQRRKRIGHRKLGIGLRFPASWTSAERSLLTKVSRVSLLLGPQIRSTVISTHGRTECNDRTLR